MKWILLVMTAAALGAACGQENLPEPAPLQAPGIYDAHIEGDFLNLTGVDDHSLTVLVDHSFREEPANTAIHIVGSSTRTVEADGELDTIETGQALHILWLNQDLRQLAPGQYSFRFDPDNLGEQAAGINVCELDQQGLTLGDRAATDITVDVILDPQDPVHGRIYLFTAEISGSGPGGGQRSSSGFRLVSADRLIE